MKYAAASQRTFFNFFLLFCFFLSSFSFSSSLFMCHYYIVSERFIGGCFVGDCFYCCSQQIISTIANESLIPYNYIKKHQIIKKHQKHRTFNIATVNANPNYIENCYLLTWKLALIISLFKNIQINEAIIFQHFLQET